MDKAELQYAIVSRRCQLPSICFIAFAIGKHKTKQYFGFIAVATGQQQKHNSIGVVAFAIGNKTTTPNISVITLCAKQIMVERLCLFAPSSFHSTFKFNM